MNIRIPNDVARGMSVSDSALRVYIYLLSFCDKGKVDQTGKLESAPSIRQMSKDLHKSVKTCVRQIRDLEKLGWLMTTKIPNTTTTYHFGNVVYGKIKYLHEEVKS